MGFAEHNRRHRKLAGRGDEYSEIWDEGEVLRPWEARVYCSGCLLSGATTPLAMLDIVTNIPEDDRFVVGRYLLDSVGCPMKGPSHMKNEIQWFKSYGDPAMAVAA